MTFSRLILAFCILAGLACGGKRYDPAHLPEDPAAAVRGFLDAVKADDLAAMGNLWGSDKGPASGWMPSDELQKRLIVMRSVLAHDSYTVDPSMLPGNAQEERVLQVRIKRGNCNPTVPFTARQYRGRWIVSAINLDAAGNPARPCPETATP